MNIDITLPFFSHSSTIIYSFCPWAWLLFAGRVIQGGPPTTGTTIPCHLQINEYNKKLYKKQSGLFAIVLGTLLEMSNDLKKSREVHETNQHALLLECK